MPSKPLGDAYGFAAVLGFSCEQDAYRMLEALPKRFARYGLKLHSTKTRLVRFERPPRNDRPTVKGELLLSPETLELLGFTHYWARSRKGNWGVKVKTAPSPDPEIITELLQN